MSNAKKLRQKLEYAKFAKQILMRLTFNKLEDLNRYILEIEHKFRTDKKSLGKSYDQEIAKIDEDIDDWVKREIEEHYAEEYWRVEETFIRQFRYSIMVNIHTIIENTLNDICSQLQVIKKLKISIDDLKGSGIERAKIYMTKVCLTEFPENTNEWSEIVKLSKFRNCIVHAEGNIRDANSPKKLEGIVKNTKGVDLSQDRYLKIKDAYIDQIQTTAKSFLKMVFGQAFQ